MALPMSGTPAGPTSVLIAHASAAARRALGDDLTGAGLPVVARTATYARTATAARRLRPTVTLLDNRLTGRATRDVGDALCALARHTHVLVLAATTDPAAITALLRGPVHGCLVDGQFEPQDLVRAVLVAAKGLAWLSPVAASAAISALRAGPGPAPARDPATRLTPREHEVLGLLSQGLSNAAIAADLGLTPKTVKNHLTRGYAKLGVDGREQAVRVFTTGPDPAGRPR
jgi:DNA-binding NarL/FixJ family response regulator